MKNFISEQPIKKLYFSSIEIAKMIKESDSCIRFWAESFGLKRIKTTKKWLFTREMVAKFHVIKELIRNQDWTIKRLKIKFKVK